MGSKYGVKRRVCLNLLIFAQKSNIVFARYLQEKANIVNTAFTQYLHTVANMQEVHIHNNFPSTVNMSNITHLLQEKWIYVVSK